MTGTILSLMNVCLLFILVHGLWPKLVCSCPEGLGDCKFCGQCK